MILRTTALVAVPQVGHGLLETLDSLDRQTHPPEEIVLLAEVDDARALAALEGLMAKPGRRLMRGVLPRHATAALHGEATLWLEAGAVLADTFVERAGQALSASSAPGWVTAQVETQWPTGEHERSPSIGSLDPMALLVDPWGLPTVALYERAALIEQGVPDPTLRPLDVLDLWLRLIAAGRPGAVLDEYLLRRRPSGVSPAQREVVLGRFAELHGDLLRRLGAPLLLASQDGLQRIGRRYRGLLRRRDEALAEIERHEQNIARRRELVRGWTGEEIVWGELRTRAPISREWGEDRGEPIDRHYIDAFIRAHRDDLQGAVLEVQENDLTNRWGGGRVERMDVVDIEAANLRATVIADLRCAAHIPDGTYDCFVLTQTLHVVADMAAVLREAHRILKPGGVLLVTLPAASRVCVEYGREGDFWRTTEAGARDLFHRVFPSEDVEITPYGNLLTTVAFLHGLARHELSPEEYAPYDPWYPLLFGVRAVKSVGERAPRVAVEERPVRGAVLLYHRVARPGLDPHRLSLAPEVFAAQMGEIGGRYSPMGLAELARGAARRELPAGAVAITFDDAYEDSLVTASPILMAHGVPATFFAVAAASERPEPFWWDVLAHALLGESATPARLVLTLDERRFDLPTADAEQRRAAHDRLYPALVRASAAARQSFLGKLHAWASLRARLPMPLSRDGLRTLADRPGHAIGAHGWDHLALAQRPAAERQADVARAKVALEGLLERPVSAFSYPYGDTSAETAHDVRAAGYEIAVACEPEGVTAATDSWRLPRIEIDPSNADRLTEILRAALGLS